MAWFPLIMRLALGAVFLAHGWDKVVGTFEPSDEQRTALADWGVAESEEGAEGESAEQAVFGIPKRGEGPAKVYGLALSLRQQELPAPQALAWLTAGTELFGGGLLVLGLLSRVAALGLTIVMGCGLWLVHWHAPGPEWWAGFNIFHPQWMLMNDGANGPERAFVLALLAFAVLVAGPGPVSVDRLLFGAGGDAKGKGRPQEPEEH